MDELKELSLNNLGLAYVSTDAFVSLQDSLTLLELRSNKIHNIPGAVHMLSHLECLDLSTNDIKTERADGSVVAFSTGLKRLKRLRIKRNVPTDTNDGHSRSLPVDKTTAGVNNACPHVCLIASFSFSQQSLSAPVSLAAVSSPPGCEPMQSKASPVMCLIS